MLYRLLNCNSASELEQEVTLLLAEGWLLYGNLVVTETAAKTLWVRELVKQSDLIELAPNA